MDTQKFTGKQMLILFGISVVSSVIAGIIIHQITKPKSTDSTTTPPPLAKQGTTPAVTMVTTPPAVEG